MELDDGKGDAKTWLAEMAKAPMAIMEVRMLKDVLVEGGKERVSRCVGVGWIETDSARKPRSLPRIYAFLEGGRCRYDFRPSAYRIWGDRRGTWQRSAKGEPTTRGDRSRKKRVRKQLQARGEHSTGSAPTSSRAHTAYGQGRRFASAHRPVRCDRLQLGIPRRSEVEVRTRPLRR